MKKLLFLIFLLIGARAQAECISASHVQSVAATYEQFAKDGKVCESDAPEKFALLKALLTLQVMKVGPAVSGGGYDDLSVPVIPNNWSNYLSLHVKKFAAGDEKRCGLEIVAYTSVTDPSSQGVIYICPAFTLQRGAGVYMNIATLLHEARHFEYNVDHVTCLNGEHKGKSISCDESMAQKGSYAVSIQVMAKMSRPETKLHPVAQASMRAAAIAAAFGNLNHAPKISREQKPMVVTADGKLQVFAKTGSRTITENLPAGLLVPYQSQFMLYPSADEQPLQMNLPILLRKDGNQAKAITRAGDVWSAQDRETIVGLHYGTALTVRVDKSMWTATCNGEKTKGDATQAAFKGIIYPEGYSAGQTSVVVLDAQDRWGRISCLPNNEAAITWENPQYTQLNKVMKVGADVYGVTHGGHLVRLAVRNGQRAWAIVKEVKSTRVRDIQALDWIRYLDQN